ncbi:MAG: ABC transporter permease [Anaerolineae bacterium]
MSNTAISGPPEARRPRRHLLSSNPVVLKELRGRMRGARAFVVLSVYLLLMAGFTVLLYMLSTTSQDIAGYAKGAEIGRVLFAGIVAIELFLVTFIAPAFTASAISGERERQTYDLLKTTLLPASSLVFGKLISALSYVLLLLLAAIPLQSIAFLFGGVAETEVVLAFVILLVTGIALGTIGIYFSATQPRTLSANVTTYAVTLTITIGLPLVIFVLVALVGSILGAQQVSVSVQAFLLHALMILVATNPLATAYTTQYFLINNQGAAMVTVTLRDATTITQATVLSPWILFTVLYLILSVIMVIRTVRRVRRIDA